MIYRMLKLDHYAGSYTSLKITLYPYKARDNTKVLTELQETEDSTVLVSTAPVQEFVICIKLQACI